MSVKTEDAQITSTAVEIDTLRVSKRQLTLRTFRQIQRGPVIDSETHEVRDTIWGWVNYFWGDNEGDIHALWQDGKTLRRSPIPYLRPAKELLYASVGGMRTPNKSKMPSRKLREAVEELEPTIHDMRPSRYHSTGPMKKKYQRAVQKIQQTDEFSAFSELVDEWNEKVRAVEGEGQIFIAT
jgi:hypothetical protein